jgi:hypothetical protein
VTRQEWRAYYRMIRVGRREIQKAYEDAIIYGVGFTRVGFTRATDLPGLTLRHVPAHNVNLHAEPKDAQS